MGYSTFGGLNMVARSLSVHQVALNTVGHNVSNADTEGYSRQRVNMVVMTPTGEYVGRYGNNRVGDGVIVGSIMRARDIFADRQYWKESSNLGYLNTETYVLNKMESVFREPSDTGIQTVLNKFWTSWQTLGANASDSGTRTTVATQGEALAKAVKTASNQLHNTIEDINFTITANVTKINQIIGDIEKLNKQIAFVEVGTHDNANDLRDSRDLLVDELSGLMDITVREEANSKYTITAALNDTGAGTRITLVNSDGSYKLSTKTAVDPDFGYEAVKVVSAADTTIALEFTNGEMKALEDYRDSAKGIKGSLINLADISMFLLQDFNDLHKAGYGTDNLNGRNFFGVDGTNYSDPAVAAGMTLGDWIDTLAVNSNITANAAGLAIIAAKTAPNAVSAVQNAVNLGTGVPTITTSGAYSGAGAMDVLLRVDSVDGAGKVTGLSYSEDGGTTWTAAAAGGADQFTATISGADVAWDTSGMANSAVNNQYSFALSGGNVAGAVTAEAANQGTGTFTITTSGAYNAGVLATTNVLLEVRELDASGGVGTMAYTTDGGATWYEVVGNTTDPNLFIADGVTVSLGDFSAGASGFAVGDRYSFDLSAGSVAGAAADAAVNQGTGAPSVVSATGVYSGGAIPTDVVLRVTSVGGGGAVTGLEYSTDGGETWSTDVTIAGDSATLKVAGVDLELSLAGVANAGINDKYGIAISSGNNASGNNAILLGNRLKTDTSYTLGGISLDSYYATLIGNLGVQSQDAQRMEANQQTVIDQLYNLRQDTCGVNIDEEMTDMIRYQKGYNSAARIVTAMDEMLEKLINGTGIVGR